eukprot:6437306-Amphidinium_carterae.1
MPRFDQPLAWVFVAEQDLPLRKDPQYPSFNAQLSQEATPFWLLVRVAVENECAAAGNLTVCFLSRSKATCSPSFRRPQTHLECDRGFAM